MRATTQEGREAINLAFDEDKLSDMIESLKDYQLREVLHHLAVINPIVVEMALHKVFSNEDSVSTVTQKVTNTSAKTPRSFTTPNRTISGGDTQPALFPRTWEKDIGDTDQPPARRLSPTTLRHKIFPSTETVSADRTALVKPPSSSKNTPILARHAIPASIAASGAVVAYLIYEPTSSGKLVLHYSASPLEQAIGACSPGVGKSIPAFKVKQNSGRSDLIGNCAGGVAGRKNYFSGWCQFVRAAKGLNGTVTLLEPSSFVGLPVDIYVYMNQSHSQTVKFHPGVPVDVSNILAVSALPKHTSFYSETISIDLIKWLSDAGAIGASSML